MLHVGCQNCINGIMLLHRRKAAKMFRRTLNVAVYLYLFAYILQTERADSEVAITI